MSAAADRDVDAVTALIDELYGFVLHSDRSGFDTHLAPNVTTWESHLPRLLHGLEDLDIYRDRRAAAGRAPSLRAVTAAEPLIDVFDDVAVARYILTAEPADGSPPERFRVTDVLRRTTDGRWLIVHHHSERRGEVTA